MVIEFLKYQFRSLRPNPDSLDTQRCKPSHCWGFFKSFFSHNAADYKINEEQIVVISYVCNTLTHEGWVIIVKN